MKLSPVVVPFLTLALACSSTSLHPHKGYGAYAVLVAPSQLTQSQPVIEKMRDRLQYLDVVTTFANNTSTYKAIIALEPAGQPSAFRYTVVRNNFPAQKGVVTVADGSLAGLDQLIDDASGNRSPYVSNFSAPRHR